MQYPRHRFQRGTSIIEIMLAIALMAVLLPALIVGLIATREGKPQEKQRLQATAMMTQTLEALRSVRETSWNSIATPGTYHLVQGASNWTLAPGISTNSAGITQSIVLSNVNRSNGAIVTTGGTLDPSTMKAVVTIIWHQPYDGSTVATTYLTRYLGTTSKTLTTVADFSPGTFTGTTGTNTSGGEVTLAYAGRADWCRPQDFTLSTLTMPKNGNAIMAQPGSAWVGTGDGTAGPTFLNMYITDPANNGTPSATIVSTYTSSYKTNAVFSDNHYAYLAADGSSSQVVILDITANPYTRIGWIDVPSGLPANGIYVQGNVAYVTSGQKLYTYDVTTKTGAHSTPLGSTNMFLGFIGYNNPIAKQVIVVGSYAYVATANTLFGLQKILVTNNGTAFDVVGVSNLTWNQQAQGLAVNPTGTRAYVAFNQGAGYFANGFFIVDTSPSDPPWWWPLPNFYNIVGTYNTGSTDPRGMAVTTGNRAIVTGVGGTQQYQVVDISNEANPVNCGGLTIPSGVSGVATVTEPDGDAFAYAISGENSNQFKIIEGGQGGGAFSTSGTYDSPAFDPGSSTAYNYFTAKIAQPSQTSIQMQVAVASPSAGACNGAAYNFVGPTATAGAYFTPQGASISGTIPFSATGGYLNPQRCYKFRSYFSTTDFTQTPVLYDVTTTYTP